MGRPNTSHEALMLLEGLIQKEAYRAIRNPYTHTTLEFSPTPENAKYFEELHNELYIAKLWGTPDKYILTGNAWECFPKEKEKRDADVKKARNTKYIQMLKRVF